MITLSRSTAASRRVEVAVGQLDADRIAGREHIRLEGQRHRSRHLADDLAPPADQLGGSHIAVLRAQQLDVDLSEVRRISTRGRVGPSDRRHWTEGCWPTVVEMWRMIDGEPSGCASSWSRASASAPASIRARIASVWTTGVPCGMVSEAIMLSESTRGMKLNLRKPPTTSDTLTNKKDQGHRHRQVPPLEGEVEALAVRPPDEPLKPRPGPCS